MFATSLRFDPSVAYGTLLAHVDRMDWTYRRVRRSQVCNQLALLERTMHFDFHRLQSLPVSDGVIFSFTRKEIDASVRVEIGLDETFVTYIVPDLVLATKTFCTRQCSLDTLLSLTPDDIRAKNSHDIALQKHRSLCLAAIAMAAHPRLGARSPLAMIVDADLLQEILRLSAC